ncbi:pre-mRNA-splicing factor SLU7-like [Pyrus ussuriensis x Pyrus communis]|uniref:Pre-mRNA-splicing factor SLU7 n=1 Tax=Pyrus ussuriensis x Pyrus communis TaxID=2448454 RepID=A0A5N5FNI8_9ROSA|nr:pre-mRNA-splicing factor SLU7-like [Pyrus ussuriensis x Pyrus communis]
MGRRWIKLSTFSSFKSRADYRKQMESEEAQKAGLAAAEIRKNPFPILICQCDICLGSFLSISAWNLKHQRKWKSDPNYTKSWYDRGAKTFQADKYPKGACENCGAITHTTRLCMERPRKKGARWTNMHIAPDEKIESFELDYDGKRNRWNGFDAATYARITETYEARRKYLKELQIKKLEEKNNKLIGEGEISEDDEDDDAQKVDEAKVDESKQMDFAKVEKYLRIREDTTKYHLSLDVNSAYYDLKTHNKYRASGQALEFKQLNIHAWEKYVNAATEEELPNELLLGHSEKQVEYDRSGRDVKGMETSLPKSKYEEDVYINNHTSCSKQTILNIYYTSAAGIEASKATSDLMKVNINARKVASEEAPAPTEEKRVAMWGTNTPNDLVLDQKKNLMMLLRRSFCGLHFQFTTFNEDDRRAEEKDERKRKYNVKSDDEVTLEEMEAYQMKKICHGDPIKEFVH